MRILTVFGLVFLVVSLFASPVYADVDGNGTAKSLLNDILRTEIIVKNQGDNFTKISIGYLDRFMKEMAEIAKDKLAAEGARKCLDLAQQAKIALLQREPLVALIRLDALKYELKALNRKVASGGLSSNDVHLFTVFAPERHPQRLRADLEAEKAVRLLESADQRTLGFKTLRANRGGDIVSVGVKYTCKYIVNEMILAAKKVTVVSIDMSDDSYLRLHDAISILHRRGDLVLGIDPVYYNNGKRLNMARIWSIPKVEYLKIMKR